MLTGCCHGYPCVREGWKQSWLIPHLWLPCRRACSTMELLLWGFSAEGGGHGMGCSGQWAWPQCWSSWGAGTPLCDAGLGLGAAVCSWRLDSVILMVPSSSDSVQLRMLCGSELDMHVEMKLGFTQNERFNVIDCYWMAPLTRKNKRGTSSLSAALSSKLMGGLKDTQADFKAAYHTVTMTIFSVLSLRIWSSFCPWGLFMLPASANCTRSSVGGE